MGALEQRTRDVETAVRRVRWFAIPFALLQFGLFEAPAAVGPLPFPRWPVAALYVVVLLATNVLSLTASRRASHETLRRIGLLELVIDATLANGIVILFGFDPTSRMWPLLSFTILEGAMRAELGGAIAIWAYGAGTYAVDQVLRLPGRDDPAAWVASIPWGAGILFLLALGTGILARRVQEATLAQESEAEGLRRLAELARHISAPRAVGDVHDRVITAVQEITGLQRVTLYERHESGGWVRRAERGTTGVVGPDPEPVAAFDRLAEGLHEPGEVEVDGELAERADRLVPGASRIWAAPVRHEGRLLGLLLVAANPEDEPDTRSIAALLGLLAAHAAVALENARVAEAEERTIRDLRELDQLKDDFLSILTHELRTPMASVSGAAELLFDRFDQLDRDRREDLLSLIRRGTRRLNALIGDVLDAMRAERLELPIDARPTPLGPLLAEVAREEVGASDVHELVLDLDATVPPALVDPGRVQQIVQNLVSNAVKYSPTGGAVTVALRARDDHVVISVADQGLGISPAARPRLFGRFQRIHDDPAIPGTGLGLYLVKNLTEAMGGTIEVESRPAAGSTFRVNLPLAR